MTTFILGVLLGALASWFFTWLYYRKAAREANRQSNLQGLGLELAAKGEPFTFKRSPDKGLEAATRTASTTLSGVVLAPADEDKTDSRGGGDGQV